MELTSSSLKLSHLPSYEALATKQSYQLPLSQSEFLHEPPAHQQGSFPITSMKSHLFKLCFPFVLCVLTDTPATFSMYQLQSQLPQQGHLSSCPRNRSSDLSGFRDKAEGRPPD